MAKICDNKSVGMIFRDGSGRILLIERKKYNPGFALPAGHQDGDTSENTARKESGEEVGFEIAKMNKVYEKDLPNPCKQDGGTHHLWTIFDVQEYDGSLKIAPDEVKKAEWLGVDEIKKLAEKFESFVKKYGFELAEDELPGIVAKTNEDEEWQKNPGLEPPMYFIFKTLGII